jgi:hypothetical protein
MRIHVSIENNEGVVEVDYAVNLSEVQWQKLLGQQGPVLQQREELEVKSLVTSQFSVLVKKARSTNVQYS